MRIGKIITIIALLFMAGVLTSCELPSLGKKKDAGLQVYSKPKATVFLNDEHVGQTTYFNEKLKPGEYRLKLVPESADAELEDWESMVKLSPGILTIVEQMLGETEEESGGYTMRMEPIAEKENAKISVVSTPDSVVVSLDDEPKGFTPLTIEDVQVGDHVLSVSSRGYEEQLIETEIKKGFSLNINVELAEMEEEEEASPSAESESEPSPSPSGEEDEEADKPASSADKLDRPYVEIKSTPTGWLNVRSEPSTAKGNETVLVKVDVGEVFKFVEENESGWIKIEYEEEKMGWVSGSYVTVYR